MKNTSCPFLVRIALALVVAFGSVHLTYAQFISAIGQNAPSADLTADQWREDLHYLATELPKRHKNLFHSVKREEFEAAVKNLHERLPALEDHEAIVEMMRIVAMIGDGHTRLRFEQALGRQGVYALRLYWYKDGLFVQAAAVIMKTWLAVKFSKSARWLLNRH